MEISLLRDANENLWFMERNKLRAKIEKYEGGREGEGERRVRYAL